MNAVPEFGWVGLRFRVIGVFYVLTVLIGAGLVTAGVSQAIIYPIALGLSMVVPPILLWRLSFREFSFENPSNAAHPVAGVHIILPLQATRSLSLTAASTGNSPDGFALTCARTKSGAGPPLKKRFLGKRLVSASRKRSAFTAPYCWSYPLKPSLAIGSMRR